MKDLLWAMYVGTMLVIAMCLTAVLHAILLTHKLTNLITNMRTS